jgi:hypothetical protein
MGEGSDEQRTGAKEGGESHCAYSDVSGIAEVSKEGAPVRGGNKEPFCNRQTFRRESNMTTRIDPKYLAAGLLCASIAAPTLTPAQSYHHRHQQENTWRNLTYGASAVGLMGLLGHNGTVTTIGAAGTLYSAYRWQQEVKSRDSRERARAEVFSRSAYDYGGHHYVRHSKMRNGQKYYYFTREG